MSKLRCETLSSKGRRCKNPSHGRHNGLDLCFQHKKQSEKTFAAAEQRWKDAGEPESDL
jgi:hypothetical protein